MKNAIEYLKQVEKLNILIENKQLEVEQWKDIAEGITGQADGERVQASKSKQKMADAVNRYTDIEMEICELAEKKQEIIRTLEELPAAEYDVLYKYYIQQMQIREVALLMNKSITWVKDKKRKGEAEIQMLLNMAHGK